VLCCSVEGLAHVIEGMHDLKIDQSLAPTREVLNNAFAAGSSAFATGSSSIFRAFGGARTNIATKLKEREETERIRKQKVALETPSEPTRRVLSLTTPSPTSGLPSPPVANIRASLGGIGSGIGSFFGVRPETGTPAQLRSRNNSDPNQMLKTLRLSTQVSSHPTVRVSQASEAGPSRPVIPIIKTLEEIRAWRRSARERKLEVGIVPTVSQLLDESLYSRSGLY
jgi:hypothetical protein